MDACGKKKQLVQLWMRTDRFGEGYCSGTDLPGKDMAEYAGTAMV